MTPDRVLHVGDSLRSDVAGANALGIDTAWVNPSGRAAPKDPRARPTHVVADVGAVAGLL